MGKLIDGTWHTQSIISSDKDGDYKRIPRSFLDQISDSNPTYKPEANRYHLYVSYACPWAHRTLIYRKLKSLESHISVDVVHPEMMDKGWHFETNFPNSTGDSLYKHEFLHQLYQQADPTVSTSVTVPVLWDKVTKTIVNNESSQIIRIFNSAFNELTGNQNDYYPEHLRKEIDQYNTLIYDTVNNGVYRAGFAKTQDTYENAVNKLFATLDQLDHDLSDKEFLVGNQLTEADLRLIPTLLRFDLVYYIHFKCSIKRLSDYKHLSRYLENIYKLDAIKSTSNFEHIKRHYYYSHEDLNPHRIVPKVQFFVGSTLIKSDKTS